MEACHERMCLGIFHPVVCETRLWHNGMVGGGVLWFINMFLSLFPRNLQQNIPELFRPQLSVRSVNLPNIFGIGAESTKCALKP